MSTTAKRTIGIFQMNSAGALEGVGAWECIDADPYAALANDPATVTITDEDIAGEWYAVVEDTDGNTFYYAL